MRFWAGYNVLLMASIVGSAYAKKILIKLQSDVADIYQTATYSVHNNFGKNYRFLWNTYSVGVLAVLVLFFMSGLVYAQTNSFLKSSQLVNTTLENSSKKLTSANVSNDTLVGSMRASRIYEETAKKGSSYSSLAYHALSRFSTDMNLNLSDEEMVYATNRVATLYATKPLQINMKVDFKYEDLLLYSKESISLPQSKKNSLRNFVKLSYKSN
jgi:hypothetical protein